MTGSDQALAGLGALVGGGGLSAVLVAFFGFLTEARKGRRPPAEGTTTIGAGLKADRWAEISAGHLAVLAHTLSRAVAILEVEAEQRFDGKDFHERVTNKLWRSFGSRDGPGPPSGLR